MVKLSFWRRWVCRNQMKGQSLVDFALFAPILILLLAGTVDFGNGFQTWVSLTNAVREGARRGASFGDASVICKRVQEELASDGITINCGAGSNVTINYPILNDGATLCTGIRTKRCPIRVTVTYSLNTLLGSVLGFNSISISAFNDEIVYNL